MKAHKDEKVNKLQIEKLIIKLQKDLEFIKDDVEAILLYGSCASGTRDVRPDIDICIVKPRKIGILQRLLKKVGARYDIKIFEDLPLYVGINVIENYRIMDNRFHSVSEMEMTRRKWLETRRQIPVKA